MQWKTLRNAFIISMQIEFDRSQVSIKVPPSDYNLDFLIIEPFKWGLIFMPDTCYHTPTFSSNDFILLQNAFLSGASEGCFKPLWILKHIKDK